MHASNYPRAEIIEVEPNRWEWTVYRFDGEQVYRGGFETTWSAAKQKAAAAQAYLLEKQGLRSEGT